MIDGMISCFVSIRSLRPLDHNQSPPNDLELDRDHSAHHLKPPCKEKDRIVLCKYKVCI